VKPAPPASRREGGGGRCPVDTGRRRIHRGEAAEDEDGDTTPDLLLKHSDITLANIRLNADETFETCILNTCKNTRNHYKNICNIQIKYL
jgi:hypothetical protein